EDGRAVKHRPQQRLDVGAVGVRELLDLAWRVVLEAGQRQARLELPALLAVEEPQHLAQGVAAGGALAHVAEARGGHRRLARGPGRARGAGWRLRVDDAGLEVPPALRLRDRKSTRLNSSH